MDRWGFEPQASAMPRRRSTTELPALRENESNMFMKFMVPEHDMVSKNVKLLGITSLINDMSSEIIFPLLPFFLISLNAPPAVIGLAGGICEGFSGVVKVISGYLSDLIGKRKPVVFLGYALSQLSKLGIALSANFETALAFMLLERSGKGLRTAPRDALIAESSEMRGKAFGYHRAMDSLGAVFGAVFAYILFYYWRDVRKVILTAAIAGLLSLMPVLMLKDKSSKKKPKLSMRIKRYVLFSVIFGSANLSYMFFLMKIGVKSGLSFNALLSALIMYAAFNVVYSALSYPAGSLSDRIGKRTVASAGYLFMTLSCVLAVSVPLLSLVTLGVFMALTDAVQRSFAAEIAESYGFGLGAFQLSFGVSSLVANTLYGFIWGINPNFTFFTVAVLAAVSSVAFLIV